MYRCKDGVHYKLKGFRTDLIVDVAFHLAMTVLMDKLVMIELLLLLLIVLSAKIF